jgi:hypothetical protein
VRVSCARSLRRAADAGNERPIRPVGHVAADPGQDIDPGAVHAGCPKLLAGRLGPLPLLPRDTRWLRRNAVSPHGVRLSGAPGAPFSIGCSSANRVLTGKLLWDGTIAVPKVFDSGCSVLFSAEERGQPGGSARSGDAGERYCRLGAPRLISLACGHIATHGGTQGVAGIVDIRRLSEQHESTLAPRGPLYRVDGPSGFTQAAENHGRTISERHNRTPR